MNPLEFLSRLISIPSPSRSEAQVSAAARAMLEREAIATRNYGCNLLALAEGYDPSRPTLMLNSHLDTVKPAPSWTRPPFTPAFECDRLYGLGSNDAGASVAALTAAFAELRSEPLPFNLMLALTVEEEVGGEGGMRLLLKGLEEDGLRPDMVIVGEPTAMQPAVGERGLVVMDCVTHGVTGHAARNEGVNAIYLAMADIDRVINLRLPRESALLGPVKFSVTQIEAGRQHNVVPDSCRWVIDSRTTDAYTNEQTVELVRQALSEATEATPRSTRVQASVISAEHPMVRAAVGLGLTPFVSPTTSDMSLLHGIPSLKIGPGESSRSHTADEYILISEIEAAVPLYLKLIRNIRL